MPTFPPKLGAATTGTRYAPRGVRAVYALPAVAGYATPVSPTRAELSAGTDLTASIAAMSGWSESSNFSEVPDLGSQVAAKIADGVTLDDSSITLWANTDDVDASAFFVRDALWYIWIAWGGDVAARFADTFRVRVSSNSHTPDITGGQQISVGFALVSPPNRRLVIPANP